MLTDKTATESRRFSISLLPVDWQQLDQIKTQAQAAGLGVDLEKSIAQHIRREIKKAEKKLNAIELPGDVGFDDKPDGDQANGNERSETQTPGGGAGWAENTLARP